MESTSPKPFVFVVMPLSSDFDDVYKLGIKPACEEAGAYAERVDEQIFEESILQRIYNQISKADVIVSDMTGRNPNVFYETGYAHALGKPVVLLTRTADDIPFDLKHYPHIIYGGRIAELIPELVKRVGFAIARPREAAEKGGIEVYVDGKSLKTNPALECVLKGKPAFGFSFEFDFHNSVHRRIKKVTFQIGILASDRIGSVVERYIERPYFASYPQPDGKITLHLSAREYCLRPDSWDCASLLFGCRKESPLVQGEKLDIVLRIFTEDGTVDFPFTVTGVEPVKS